MEARMNTSAVSVRGHVPLRAIAYWAATLIVTWEMVAGSMWDLLRIEYVRGVLEHLGYPQYLLLILGAWKLPCAIALLVPGFGRLKEWAYAGAFFNYTGAAASHLISGDGPSRWAGLLLFTLITLGSWALRPPDRRLVPAPEPTPTRAAAWIVPLALIAAFLVISLLTLPKGPAPV
jgi:DoxX-like protein